MRKILDSSKKALDRFKKSISKKEEYSNDSAALPDTARDLYGDVSDVSNVVEEPDEQGGSDNPPSELPEISFGDSSKKESPKEEPSAPEPNLVDDELTIVKEELPAETVEDAKVFDDAIKDMYPGNSKEEIQEINSENLQKNQESDNPQINSGFFSEFHRFLDGNDIPKVADDLLAKDLLEKMKEYHMLKSQGKDYYFHTDELKDVINEHLTDLRTLEKDWFNCKEQLFKTEAMLLEKEREISEKVERLGNLLKEVKLKEEFRKSVAEEDYFHLGNGQVLKSLSDLGTALRVMEDGVFHHHANDKRNDFSQWVKNVFGNSFLADILKGCTSREEMIRVLENSEKP